MTKMVHPPLPKRPPPMPSGGSDPTDLVRIIGSFVVLAVCVVIAAIAWKHFFPGAVGHFFPGTCR